MAKRRITPEERAELEAKATLVHEMVTVQLIAVSQSCDDVGLNRSYYRRWAARQPVVLKVVANKAWGDVEPAAVVPTAAPVAPVVPAAPCKPVPDLPAHDEPASPTAGDVYLNRDLMKQDHIKAIKRAQKLIGNTKSPQMMNAAINFLRHNSAILDGLTYAWDSLAPEKEGIDMSTQEGRAQAALHLSALPADILEQAMERKKQRLRDLEDN